MDIDQTIDRVKRLIAEREKIDAELSELLVIGPKRGRPPKRSAEQQESVEQTPDK